MNNKFIIIVFFAFFSCKKSETTNIYKEENLSIDKKISGVFMEDADYYEQLIIDFDGCTIQTEKSGASEEIEILKESIKIQDVNGDQKNDVLFYYLKNHDGVSYEVVTTAIVNCKTYTIENTIYQDGVPLEDMEDVKSIDDYKIIFVNKVTGLNVNNILKTNLIENWSNYINQKFDN